MSPCSLHQNSHHPYNVSLIPVEMDASIFFSQKHVVQTWTYMSLRTDIFYRKTATFRRWPLLGQYPTNATEKKSLALRWMWLLWPLYLNVSGVEPEYLRVPGHMLTCQANVSSHDTSQPFDVIPLRCQSFSPCSDPIRVGSLFCTFSVGSAEK